MVESGRYKVKKEKTQSRFFLLLSVVLLVVLVKWGLPAFINILAGSPGGRIENKEEDLLPPQKPVLSALPEAVNLAEISVSGFTEAKAATELIVDGEGVLTGTADEQGSFEFKYTLDKGEHSISVRAKDEAGNSSESEMRWVTFDPEKLDITITDPKDGSEIIGVGNKNISIKGKVNKGETNVKVNGSYALVSEDGEFSQTITLSEGDNQIKIEASDKAGNVAEKTINLKFYP
jgi:hypothetical protein